MTPSQPVCHRCSSPLAAQASHCSVCAAPLASFPGATSPNAMNTPPPANPSGPDFGKIGFGAMGNVEVKHDASHHSHTHYHGVPPAAAQPAPSPSGGRQRRSPVNVTVVFSLGAMVAMWFLFKSPVSPPPPASVPAPAPAPASTPFKVEIHNNPVNTVHVGNHPVGSPAMSQYVPSTQPLQLRLNQASYKVGEEMHITVTSEQAGYLYVLAVWADGRVDTLFPNTLRPEAKIAAGTALRLPDDFPMTAGREKLNYPMEMPALSGNPDRATESILAVLSPVPLDLPRSTTLASPPGFTAIGKINDPEFRTRGPQPRFIQMHEAPTLDFGALPQAAIHYEIHR